MGEVGTWSPDRVGAMSNQSKKPLPKAPNPLAGLEPASWGRRIGALFIDWIASTLVLIAIIGPHRYSGPNGTVLVLPVALVEIALFTLFIGGSFGQVALRVRVRRLDGVRLTPGAVLVRTVLVLLVIPPLIYKSDGRGLHDMAVNSAAFHLL